MNSSSTELETGVLEPAVSVTVTVTATASEFPGRVPLPGCYSLGNGNALGRQPQAVRPAALISDLYSQANHDYHHQ